MPYPSFCIIGRRRSTSMMTVWSASYFPFATVFFDPFGLPGPRFFFRPAFAAAIFSATALGGRPGPPGRHVPRVRRRFRRPFVAFFGVRIRFPKNPSTACCTSVRTRSRMTVSKFLGRGIGGVPPLMMARLRMRPARVRFGRRMA